MNKRLISGLTLLSFFTSFAVFANDQTAKQWLERMVDAVNNLKYQGTFIYLHDNQLEAMRIVHGITEDGKQRERLISLNGAPREVIRDQSSVTCVMPESQEISVDKRQPLSRKFLAQLPEDLRQLDAHYLFRKLGKGRVAGRDARVVAIIPKDGLRYGYRFFLDEQSALPLKSDLMNEHGKAVEQTMFTQLDIGVADIKEVQDDLLSAQSMRIKSGPSGANTSQSIDDGAWTFHNLPEGFAVSMRNTLPDPGEDETIDQYVLSDGLASLSVFVETAGREEALNGLSRLGSINAWGGQLEGYQVTVVGEVPEVTLLGIVNAMQLKQ